MKFTKMQGIGNDYVYLYGTGDSIADIPALARRVSDRHFGVGSDGLILIDPPDSMISGCGCIMPTDRSRLCAGTVPAVWENMYTIMGIPIKRRSIWKPGRVCAT